jgi:hypothetical protein
VADWVEHHLAGASVVFVLVVFCVCFNLFRCCAAARPVAPPPSQQPPSSGGVRAHPLGRSVRLSDGRTARLVGGRELAELEADGDAQAYTNSRTGAIDVVTRVARPGRPPRNPAYRASQSRSAVFGAAASEQAPPRPARPAAALAPAALGASPLSDQASSAGEDVESGIELAHRLNPLVATVVEEQPDTSTVRETPVARSQEWGSHSGCWYGWGSLVCFCIPRVTSRVYIMCLILTP